MLPEVPRKNLIAPAECWIASFRGLAALMPGEALLPGAVRVLRYVCLSVLMRGSAGVVLKRGRWALSYFCCAYALGVVSCAIGETPGAAREDHVTVIATCRPCTPNSGTTHPYQHLCQGWDRPDV